MKFSRKDEKLITVGNANGKFFMFDMLSPNPLPIINIQLHKQALTSISCNYFLPFLYLTTSDDGVINLVDVNAQKVDRINAASLPQEKSNVVIWHPKHKNLFAVGEVGGAVSLYDLSVSKKRSVLNMSSEAVLSLDFGKFEQTVVTGSTDTTVKIFDMRNAKLPSLVLSGHRYSVCQVKCSPFQRNGIISCSYDMSVKVWDANNVAQPLVKSHDKHREFVYDVDCSPFVQGLIGSASLDKSFCVFQERGEQPYSM